MKTGLYYIMREAAEKAGRSLMRDFSEVENLQVSIKGPGDFVTKADTTAEDIIISVLEKARPDIGFLAEESSFDGDIMRPLWIIDPLDGTTNFLHGIPHFAVSIALSEGNRLVAGMIYDPIKDECFFAEDKKGAYLNDRLIHPSKRNKPAEAVFATGVPFIGKSMLRYKNFIDQISGIMPHTAGVRRFGAAALDLAYVACGRYDGFWEEGLHIWDIAAGIVIMREAGGMVSDLSGKRINHWQASEQKQILASNVDLHRFMTDALSKHQDKK